MDCTPAEVRKNKRRRLNEIHLNDHPPQHTTTTTTLRSVSVQGFLDRSEHSSGFTVQYDEHLFHECVEANEFGNAKAEANPIEDPGHPANPDGECCYGMVSMEISYQNFYANNIGIVVKYSGKARGSPCILNPYSSYLRILKYTATARWQSQRILPN